MSKISCILILLLNCVCFVSVLLIQNEIIDWSIIAFQIIELVWILYIDLKMNKEKIKKIIIIFMKTGKIIANCIATSLIWIVVLLHLIIQFENIDGLLGFQIGILITQVIYNCCD